MKRLEGKVAVITGENSGIGLAAGKRLLEEGTKIASFGRAEGDPRKIADVIVQLANSDEVPVRLILGVDGAAGATG